MPNSSSRSSSCSSEPLTRSKHPSGTEATMTAKLTAERLRRRAIVYIRQSRPIQVVQNLESQRRQYGLVDRAREIGFRDIVTVDDDLGRSGDGLTERPGFQRVVAEVCSGEVGAVLCIEASRLARNGREWHHLIDLCGMVGTVVIDHDGIYDPVLLNDRLLLGLKRPDSYSTSCSTSFRRSVTRLRRLFDGTRVVSSQPTTHPWWRRERTTERCDANLGSFSRTTSRSVNLPEILLGSSRVTPASRHPLAPGDIPHGQRRK